MKTIERGDVLPYGLFRKNDGWHAGPALCLRIPVWASYGKRWEPVTDTNSTRWWVLSVLVKRIPHGVTIMWGWA